MERVIRIDNKDVPFKCTAGTARRYRFLYGKDIITDASRLLSGLKAHKDGTAELTPEMISIFEDLAYVMAKQADPDVPDDQGEWLDRFTMFSIYSALPEIVTLWSESMQGIESVKKNRVVQTARKTKKSGR